MLTASGRSRATDRLGRLKRCRRSDRTGSWGRRALGSWPLGPQRRGPWGLGPWGPGGEGRSYSGLARSATVAACSDLKGRLWWLGGAYKTLALRLAADAVCLGLLDRG